MHHSLAPTTAMAAAVLLGATGAVAGEPETVKAMFESLDRNGNGYIALQEAETVRGLAELLPHYDVNGDGRLDAEEFRALVEEAVQETRILETEGPSGE